MQDNQFYDDYQSPLGYRALKNGYDTYGVDHSQFTTREEVEYQDKRIKREEELMQQQRNMGITGNYMQYGTNFWNTSPENNYGFGGSEIKNLNAENYNSTILPNNRNSKINDLSINPGYYLGYGVGYIHSDIQDPNGYINSFKNIMNYNKQYRPKNVNDKYKHAMINCLMAQNGSKSEKVSQILSGLKENYDVLFNKNTSQASDEDMEANIYGRNIGRTYPQGSCHDLITQKYNP